MAQLPKFDDEFAKLQQGAQSQQQVLRYVGVVDVKQRLCHVKLKRYKSLPKSENILRDSHPHFSYPATHPFAGLSGSDNIIAFSTDRFPSPNPLIIQGAGAGASVTVFGILSDLLKVANNA
jgi:homoserine dehydrogenase